MIHILNICKYYLIPPFFLLIHNILIYQNLLQLTHFQYDLIYFLELIFYHQSKTLPLPIIIIIQVITCNKTHKVRMIATLSALLLSSNSLAPIALHQYSHIYFYYTRLRILFLRLFVSKVVMKSFIYSLDHSPYLISSL